MISFLWRGRNIKQIILNFALQKKNIIIYYEYIFTFIYVFLRGLYLNLVVNSFDNN